MMATPVETPNTQTQTQPNGAAPAAGGSPGGMPPPNDMAQKTHNAFILGWSLVELRSRIQLAALDETMLPRMAKDGQPKQEQNPQATTIPANPIELVTDKNDRLLRASRLRTIFNTIVSLQLDWFPNCITVDTLYDPPREDELPYLFDPADPHDNMGKPPDSALETIAEGAESSGANNENPVGAPAAGNGKRRGSRYGNIGIQPPRDKDGKPLLDTSGKPVWTDFRLFEITRRAINCLTLLQVSPEESLVPTQVQEWQDDLTTQVLEAAEEQNKKAGSKARSLTATAIQSVQPQEKKDAKEQGDSADTPKAAPLIPRTRQGQAIHTLSFLIVRLLQAWDGYLRERITAEGVDSNNLVTLVAYEAGRNLASLSWNTSVNAIMIENQAAADGANWENLKKDMHQAWYKTFTDSNIVQVLHQITALSSVLDDAYDRSPSKPSTPPAANNDNSQDALLVRPDPARPSQVLRAVQESIEYWQRTVFWLDMEAVKDGKAILIQDNEGKTVRAANKDLLIPEDWQHLRNSLIEQSGIWFNLMTGQQDLRGFTIQNVAHQILDEQLNQFRELAQKDLPAAANQAVKEVSEVLDSATDAVAQLGKAATDAAAKGLKKAFGSVNLILVGLVLIGSIVAVIWIAVMASSRPAAGGTEPQSVFGFITSAFAALGGGFSMWWGRKKQDENEGNITQQIGAAMDTQKKAIDTNKATVKASMQSEKSGLTGLAGRALGQAGDFLLSAYDRGLQRIQIELQSLNYSVAVAHPLIEYIIRHKDNDVNEDFDFLTKVIWSSEERREQMQRVVTAAFGPLSILLTPSTKKDPDGQKTASEGNQTNPQPAVQDKAETAAQPVSTTAPAAG